MVGSDEACTVCNSDKGADVVEKVDEEKDEDDVEEMKMQSTAEIEVEGSVAQGHGYSGTKSCGYFVLRASTTVQSDIWLVRLAAYGGKVRSEPLFGQKPPAAVASMKFKDCTLQDWNGKYFSPHIKKIGDKCWLDLHLRKQA